MAIPTNRDSDKFIIRLPDGMRDRIKVAADANNRSMNAEIVATLEEKYPQPFGEHEDFSMAIAAAVSFDPKRANGRFAEEFGLVLRYIREKFGLELAGHDIAKEYFGDPRFHVSVVRLTEWLDLSFGPWAKENADAPEASRKDRKED
ncbi:Arc-like DNA binding dprotein [Rhodobacter sp. JA431]|uniref:Arc family DNA-binding protein n=1 Tax=Rhodobacter sp. JA431 TaxID=570013 RepID=UPI000BD1338C|nr:Arc family DNA-binding protein [Rhodobacter sp. JA431]SOB98839.1 Arc-like DNA binding dprotein [Rhodobacter sp. JA431]